MDHVVYLQSPVPFCCALSHSIWMGSCYSLLFQSVGKFGWHTWVSIFSKFHFNRFVYNQIMTSIKQWFLCFSFFFLKIQLNSYQDHFMIATRSRAHRICEWSSGGLVLMRSRNLTYHEEKCIENKYSIDK